VPESNAVCAQPSDAEAGHLCRDRRPRVRAPGGLFACVARGDRNFGFSMVLRDSAACDSPAQAEWPQQFSVATAHDLDTDSDLRYTVNRFRLNQVETKEVAACGCLDVSKGGSKGFHQKENGGRES
jgi:hypothetical protein